MSMLDTHFKVGVFLSMSIDTSFSYWLVFLGHSPLSWKTKKQRTVSRSSAKAEYRSMASTTCELIWLESFYSVWGYNIQKQLICIVIVNMHFILHKIWYSMSVQNILNLIVISFGMLFRIVPFFPHMFLQRFS